MAYIPTEWKNGVTPINETNLNKMETGIKGAHDAISETNTTIESLSEAVGEELEYLKNEDKILSRRFNTAPDGAEAGQVVMIESIDQLGQVKWKPVEHYHMRKETFLSWDGDDTGLQHVTTGDGYRYYKISDTPLTAEELIGSTFKFVKTSGEEMTVDGDESYIVQEGNAICYSDLLVSAIEDTASDKYGVTFTTGLWHLSPAPAGGHVSEILGEVPVKIPEKFLPETGSMPAVTEADNGKHLEVVNGNWANVAFANSALKNDVEALIDAYMEEALGGDY